MSKDRIDLELTREETGTLLGSVAWVMGALQIMRDRGHAESDEAFHELHDLLAPRLDRLLERVTAARRAAAASPELESEVEEAYGAIRRAFETWIELTAVDTLSAAVAARLDANEATGGAGGEPSAGERDPETDEPPPAS